MNPLVQPGAFTKAAVTTKKNIDQAKCGTRLVVIIEPFKLRREDQNELQVYSDLGHPRMHASMNWDELDEYFDDIEHLPNTKVETKQ